ncbi:MAG: seryl-tRNA synthetase [Bacteroidetes bacterium]|nr:seryl-tRNA synthetase [Bacteroidota bacterium]
MLDIRFIREHTDLVKDGVEKKGESAARVDEALALDERRRQLLQQSENLKSRKNVVSADVARMKAKKEDASAVIAEMRTVADEIKWLDDELKKVEDDLRSILLQIPNMRLCRWDAHRRRTRLLPHGANLL